MKQKYAVVILFCLICGSGLTSFGSYRATERVVTRRDFAARLSALRQPSSRCQTSDQHPSYGQWHCFGASTASGIIVSKSLSWHLAVWPILRLKVDSMMRWVSRSD